MEDHDDLYVIREGIILDATTGERLGVTDPDRRPFDATAHMRKIRTRQGMQDYLDVKWRVAWLRAEHPAAVVVTVLLAGGVKEEYAEFKCEITLPNGGSAMGHAQETKEDFPDFYEKAETKSIGRACAVLGFGTDAASDFDDGEPMDGRGAAKDERKERKAAPPDRHPETNAMGISTATIKDQEGKVIAQARGNAPQRPAPSRLPATRNHPPVGAASGVGEATTPILESTPIPEEPVRMDASNIHQHAQIRSLAEHGYDVGAALTTYKRQTIEELSREEAKEVIITGRAALRG